HGVEDFVEVLVQALDGARADAAGVNELLDASVAHADQRELGRHKECVGCDEEDDGKYPQQHGGDHGKVILAAGLPLSCRGTQDPSTRAPSPLTFVQGSVTLARDDKSGRLGWRAEVVPRQRTCGSAARM